LKARESENYQHLAPTSDNPLELEIERAEGIYLYDRSGRSYMDLISGISVCNIGHRNPKVIKAIKNQLDKYLHLMVFGEYIQTPQIQLAKMLSDNLPENLNCCYFVNSGSEAVEGALKLARRFTGKTEIIACKNGYHGSTYGALSMMSNEKFKHAFRPLLPECRFIGFNNINDIEHITDKTACVITETIQGDAGVIIPQNDFLIKLRKRCSETGTLLILDEVQTGFGRTGTLFAFEQYNIIPDIITIAKAMGGGMPLGAFISSKEIMDSLKTNPPLGHITTFGGHPVSCAAGIATLKILLEEDLITQAASKEKLFKKLLVHPAIKSVRGKGLLIAIELESIEFTKKVIKECIKNGVTTDWFLFAENCLRIAPPLIITEQEIKKACEVIISSIDQTKMGDLSGE